MTRRVWLGAAASAPLISATPAAADDSIRRMADTAGNFLASLTPEQKARTSFGFADEERFNFHFVPRERKGLPFREMTGPQRHLATALLGAGLGTRGFVKASSIMSLEDVLRILENDSGERRNTEKYYFSIFGDPAGDSAWGYRIEGHHLSLNFTITRDRASGSPSFFGSNPAEVRHGPRKGLRILAAEEDLARSLLSSLTSAQRDTAVIQATAFPDILTGASRKAALEGKPAGLPGARMTAKQRDLLTSLVAEYARNLPDALAAARLEKLRKAGPEVHFAWAGVAERLRPHYYRVQAPAFLIEYDNTQNGANHIHSVWRDLDGGDWGLDLLGDHYSHSPAAHGHRL
ncbi:MAG TPA: DUF3500 domain-containing protein [Bryobacteraceae bacterium]|nr:DUF3500 domain-containing protein [Bryobacteraceae bacterium]